MSRRRQARVLSASISLAVWAGVIAAGAVTAPSLADSHRTVAAGPERCC